MRHPNRRYSLVPLLAPFTALLCIGCPAPAPPADTIDVAALPDAIADDATDASDDADAGPTRVTVSTPSGPIVGMDWATTRAFLNIPYAGSPAGAGRWRPPSPVVPWTTPRDGTQFGPRCPEPASGTNPPVGDEDCLQLNVWTAARSETERLPVMVFIHGGGFTGGSAIQPLHNGRLLSTRERNVVVTLNYRLGQLGFLAHAALVAEDTVHHAAGNYGLLDQQAALRWVQSHIASFGGDPTQVTIFGESAGAISVCAHVASPLARGLFRAAIFESGSCAFIFTPLHDTTARPYESGEALGGQFARAAMCDTASDVPACLRSRSVGAVLAAVPRNLENLDSRQAYYAPVIDGYVLPENPWTAFRAGRGNPVALMLGTNLDEGTGFTLNAPARTAADFDARLATLLPDHVADLQRMFPVASFASPTAALNAVIEDLIFVCPARAHARVLAAIDPRVFLYQFTSISDFGRASGLGVFHGAELSYIFGTFASFIPRSAATLRVSQYLMDTWGRFASTLDPNGAGFPRWERFTVANDAYMDLGDSPTPRTALHTARCSTIEPWLDER